MDDQRFRSSETGDFARLRYAASDCCLQLGIPDAGHREEAEDVVQEAHLRGFRAFAGVKGEDIRPWLLMIVRNAALTALKSKGARTMLSC